MADTIASATTTTTTTSPEVKRSWGDEADEVPEEPEVLPSTSDDKTTSQLKLGSLASDNNKKVNEFLDEPEHSNIKAAKKFEDLNLSPELLKGLYVEMKFERPSKIQAISSPMIWKSLLGFLDVT